MFWDPRLRGSRAALAKIMSPATGLAFPGSRFLIQETIPEGPGELSADSKTVIYVKKAVRNLGISARITEEQTGTSIPRVVVDGFDLMTGFDNDQDTAQELSYQVIEKALERSAWTGY